MTTSHQTVRWGALATVLSGVLFTAEGLLYLADRTTPQDIVLALAYALVAAGLFGFHELQRPSVGRLGRIGFHAAIGGWLIALVGHTAALDAFHGAGFLIALVGYLLYGIATFRARLLPRWIGLAIATVGPLSIAAGELTTLVLGLFWIVLGGALWSKLSTSARRPNHRSARAAQQVR